MIPTKHPTQPNQQRNDALLAHVVVVYNNLHRQKTNFLLLSL
jgi:hypothetical protein